MTLFLIATALLTIAALAPLWFVLVRPHRPSLAAEDPNSGKRQALAAARAAGVLTQSEYDTKLAQLEQESPEAPKTPATPPARALATALALAVPLALAGLYLKYGNPAAIDPALAPADALATTNGTPPTLEAAIESLKAKLADDPGDPEGWRLLARGQQSLQDFAGARASLEKARALAPDNVDIQVEYAEAIALTSETRRIEGEAMFLLDDALQKDPEQQRALWLLGISAVQHGDTAQAITYWTKLRGLLDPESDIAKAVDQQLAELTGNAAPATSAGETNPGATQPVEAPPAATTGGVRVQVSLAPELASKVGPSAVLYVFARPASGPKMPLAIQRLPVTRLPADLVLDDSMGMMPTMKLSETPEFIVGARISQTGVANAQAGDLEGLSGVLTQGQVDGPVILRIDQVVQ